MKFGLLRQLAKLKDFFQSKIDRKVIIFLFFLLISTFFWLLNSLGKEYTTNIGFPVRYTNFPKNKVLVGDLPSKVDISIKAYGFTLLKYKIKPSLPPVNFDLRSITFHKNSKQNNIPTFYILTRYEIDKIDKQLSNDINVVGISPDTIHFQFVDVVRKQVPVVADFNYSFEKQFMQYGKIIFNPDSIFITGPQTIIDTIISIKTKSEFFENVQESINIKVDLQSIKNVKIPSNQVNFILPVEKYTEATFLVPIQILNLPDTLTMTIFPKDLKLSYLVALCDYEMVKGFMFKAYIDYNMIEQSMNDKLKIVLEKTPDFIRNYSHYPLNVDYIIEY